MRSLGRALLARCPVCGSRGVWANFGDMVDACPGCGYRFSREEGYWVGAMIINLAIPMGLFVAGLLGGILLTWPDVPWTALTWVLIVVVGLSPVLLYRQSKTIWIWLDQRIHPHEGDERDWERL